MQTDKAAAYLVKERRRILAALRQLDNSDEALQQQAGGNAVNRAELRQRLTELDRALADGDEQAETQSEPEIQSQPEQPL